ncbi:glycosyltransferase family 32 protein [Phocaeicola barnesiae]|uniref:glycosyltransferase family 32 protein n=1 Tax=Phocaeicola barnesiae TaxID=376804 RepID=UPI0003684446|nr:glycosyltransferase [Phocaeicola barnesiae]
MIPKIIHYCWLSGDPYPEKIKYCIESWKKFLPDYELILWDLNRFDINSSIWVKEAFEVKKYAFAADYIRLYALYNYGGIYLDTDVEVLRSFDSLLDLPYFIGKENTPHGIEAAVLGAEKGINWIKDCLDYYQNKHFNLGLGKFETQVLPAIMLNIISQKHEIIDIKAKEEIENNYNIPNKIFRFPVDYFSPMTWDTHELNITSNTYAIHHFAGTWKKNKTRLEKIREVIKRIIYLTK